MLIQLCYLPSGPGRRWIQRSVHGRHGSMIVPPDRSGGAVVVQLGETALSGAELRKQLGGFELDGVAAALFGPEGTEYDLPFAEVDAATIAIELDDFAGAVTDGRAAEVDGAAGLRAVAGVWAVAESRAAGGSVRIDDVADGTLVRLPAKPSTRPSGWSRGTEHGHEREPDSLCSTRPSSRCAWSSKTSTRRCGGGPSCLGIGPWTAYRLEPPRLKEMLYHGEEVEFSLRHALAWQGEMQFELVQPLDRAEHLRRPPRRARRGAAPHRQVRDRPPGRGRRGDSGRVRAPAERAGLRGRG